MIAIANFIGLPLMFLSSILISPSADAALDAASPRSFNPVNWGVIAAREASSPGGDWGSVADSPRAPARADGRDVGVRDVGVPPYQRRSRRPSARARRSDATTQITWPVATAGRARPRAPRRARAVRA